MNDNILQTIFYDYLISHPKPGEKPEITLSVPTHDPDRDNSKFRVSDAGKCRLMRYWKRQGIPPSNTPSLDIRLVMESGNLLHAWFEYVFGKMGVVETVEQEVQDIHKLGHLDCILTYNNIRILYDLKTISGKKMYYLNKNGNKPDKQHIYQVLTYYSLLRPFPDEVRIAYINRDNLEICECIVDLEDLKNIKSVMGDWAALIAAWEMNMEPEPTAEDWECNYCSYHDRCHQDG